MADTPSVTNATTNEDTQTTSGLVISRNAADGAEVTHFKITDITNGTLFQNDGTTPITNGDFITFAQGNAGLKFTPAPTCSARRDVQLHVQASTEQRRRRPGRRRRHRHDHRQRGGRHAQRDQRDDQRGHAERPAW